MITTKDLYLQNAVNAAVWYIERGEGFPRLRRDFNKLCEAWHADVFDRRHLLAQRVVIESIHALHTEQELQRLDKLMDKLAINPKLEL